MLALSRKSNFKKDGMRHWSEARLCERASNIDFCPELSDQPDHEPTTMDFDAEENTSEKPAEAAILEEQGQIFEPKTLDQTNR